MLDYLKSVSTRSPAGSDSKEPVLLIEIVPSPKGETVRAIGKSSMD